MFGELYHNRVLELAANIPNTHRLDQPDGSAECVSRLCGSRVAIDVQLDAKAHISGFGIDPHACALGQAAASVLSRQALGKSRQDIAQTRTQFAAMLEGRAKPPRGDFSELRHLEAVRDYPQRHASCLLAFDACLEAMDAALNTHDCSDLADSRA